MCNSNLKMVFLILFSLQNIILQTLFIVINNAIPLNVTTVTELNCYKVLFSLWPELKTAHLRNKLDVFHAAKLLQKPCTDF